MKIWRVVRDRGVSSRLQWDRGSEKTNKNKNKNQQKNKTKQKQKQKQNKNKKMKRSSLRQTR